MMRSGDVMMIASEYNDDHQDLTGMICIIDGVGETYASMTVIKQDGDAACWGALPFSRFAPVTNREEAAAVVALYRQKRAAAEQRLLAYNDWRLTELAKIAKRRGMSVETLQAIAKDLNDLENRSHD